MHTQNFSLEGGKSDTEAIYINNLSFYVSGFIPAVAVFRKPNAIPPYFSTDLVLNFLLSWLLVLLPSMFFLGFDFKNCHTKHVTNITVT
jgi:hypothetical protein